MTVILFQVCVIASMCLAVHFGNRKTPEAGRRYLQVAAGLWTVETLLYVFAPWLMAVQLVVIWGTYAFLTRPKPVKPPKPVETPKPVRPPQEPLGQPSRMATCVFAILLVAGIAVPVVGGVAVRLGQPEGEVRPAMATTANAADRSFLLPQPTPATVADCAARGSKYFQDIGSYPRLSDGRDAVSVAWERCQRTTTAFP